MEPDRTRMYLREISVQCSNHLRAINRVRELSAKLVSAPGAPDHFETMAEIFRELHNALVHAAAVSRILWPACGRKGDPLGPARERRGVELRKLSRSPLRSAPVPWLPERPGAPRRTLRCLGRGRATGIRRRQHRASVSARRGEDCWPGIQVVRSMGRGLRGHGRGDPDPRTHQRNLGHPRTGREEATPLEIIVEISTRKTGEDTRKSESSRRPRQSLR